MIFVQSKRAEWPTLEKPKNDETPDKVYFLQTFKQEAHI